MEDESKVIETLRKFSEDNREVLQKMSKYSIMGIPYSYKVTPDGKLEFCSDYELPESFEVKPVE